MSKLRRSQMKQMLTRYAYDHGYRDCPLCNHRMWFNGYERKAFVTVLTGIKRREVITKLVTLEHIQPKSLGGQNILKNLTLTCKHCNETRNPVLTSHLLSPLLENANDYRFYYPSDNIKGERR